MGLTAGTRIGPYQILAPLGAGGMGEVYRARDTRLGRDVALKILPAEVAADASRRQRFEQEARAVAALNHPNIVAIYDVGEGYLVTELVDGDSLRGAKLGLRQAMDVAAQMADALAAAHSAGIVHRDLKPANIMLSREGRVKVLDFGLAKQILPSDPADETLTAETRPGTVLGTLGYMAPEQVRGQPTDHRSDIFSFGIVLHELLSGQRAFSGATSADIMSAILTADPPALPDSVPAALRQIAVRCLDKEPSRRFQSAADLAFALRTLPAAVVPVTAPASSARPRWVSFAAIALLVTLAAAATFFIARRNSAPVPLRFQRLTFQHGRVLSARFAPEGRTIVYSAAWQGEPPTLYSTRPDSAESRSLGLPPADLLGISPRGEMALLRHLKSSYARDFGTLARAPLGGGAPRDLVDNVYTADWLADGNALAAVRLQNDVRRVEFPVGKLIYETPNLVVDMRVSRDGKLLAIAEHSGYSVRQSFSILDQQGKRTQLASGFAGDFVDLQWSPNGDEIWFTIGAGGGEALHAVDLKGRHRILGQFPTLVRLLDVSPNGDVLLSRVDFRTEARGLVPGGSAEQDLSWQDASEIDDVSPDGKAILFTEYGQAGGVGQNSVYVRNADSATAVRLGDGQGYALSADRKSALATTFAKSGGAPRLVLWPTGSGEPVWLNTGKLVDFYWADFLPDGKRIVFTATEPGQGRRCYVQTIGAADARPITPEGVSLYYGSRPVSSDGRWIFALGARGKPVIYPVDGGEAKVIPGASAPFRPVRWSPDGLHIFHVDWTVERPVPAPVYRLEIATGRQELWRTLDPPDRGGVAWSLLPQITPDLKNYFYSFERHLSALYLVQGLK